MVIPFLSILLFALAIGFLIMLIRNYIYLSSINPFGAISLCIVSVLIFFVSNDYFLNFMVFFLVSAIAMLWGTWQKKKRQA